MTRLVALVLGVAVLLAGCTGASWTNCTSCMKTWSTVYEQDVDAITLRIYNGVPNAQLTLFSVIKDAVREVYTREYLQEEYYKEYQAHAYLYQSKAALGDLVNKAVLKRQPQFCAAMRQRIPTWTCSAATT